MQLFGHNLKFLRQKEGLSQVQLSKKLKCGTSTLSDYETGKLEPNLKVLVQVADYFGASLDQLVREDLKEMDKQSIQYRNLDSIKNRKLRILSTTVDTYGKENIELVPNKAKAGYLSGYADPDFIADLPKMHIPNLPSGTHRGFELEGDSMLPLNHGSIVIARYVEYATELKNNGDYIIIARDGMAFKRIQKKPETLQMISFNPLYPPYEIQLGDILEAWQYYAFYDKTPLQHILSIESLQKDIRDINQKVDKLLS